jgi:hypothetical protein
MAATARQRERFVFSLYGSVTFYLTWRHISPVKEAFAKSGLFFWLNLAKAMLIVKC